MNRVFSFTAWLCLAAVVVADEPAIQAVDRSTLTGKVMCGYQGWFNCEDDGAGLGWTHWSRHRNRLPAAGNVTVDLWPDMTEYDPDERFSTGFALADGSVAEVFSSTNRKTVLRHFKWMQQYGIDGAFVQRFAAGLKSPAKRDHKNAVLSHARDGANLAGRAFAVMYDLSGMNAGEMELVEHDWRALQANMNIASDSAYLNHHGKPVVAIWGVGFSDGRRYTLDECAKLVSWFKSQNCTVMLGVPTFWRDLKRDAVEDKKLHQIIRSADIVSPWTVGRYGTPKQAKNHASNVWSKDRAWCRQSKLDFLPVVFPGFSWHNLNGDPLGAIPRSKGEFLWSQVVGAKREGCDMIYVAMFDEVDEGTAIFKCTDKPPVGDGVQFLGNEGLPTDYYLRVVGAAGRLLRNEISITDAFPMQRHIER